MEESFDYVKLIMVLAPVALLLVEYYLGKSNVPKANSIIEMVINLVKLFSVKKDPS